MNSSDSPERSGRVVEDAIHQELRAARRRPGDLPPQTMVQCPVMCNLLGNGDPEVALAELSHKIMELINSDDGITIVKTASYSLGLCIDADTHLIRLEESGTKHFFDQRQAHYYNDRGLHQLARLISTHRTTQTVPEATLTLTGSDETQAGLTTRLRCQRHTHMHPPQLNLWQGNEPQATSLTPTWTAISQPEAPGREQELMAPIIVQLQDKTTARLVWRGETGPKFAVALTGNIYADMVRSQTLGATYAVAVADEG